MFLLVIMSGFSLMANNSLPLSNTDYTKTVKKNFKMSANGEVTLANKYGNINLKTWDRNEVNVEVTITVKARNESTANEVFERVNIDFENSSNSVSAKTNIESKNSSWWSKGDKGDFRIDYEVSMPSSASIDLYNKYGDAFLPAISGNAKVSVKYGNFEMESAGARAQIFLGYGGGKIGSLKNANVEVKYSKLKIESADDVNVESRYSKIYVENANKVECNTSYDSYDIGELQEFLNQGKYDHFEIGKADHVNLNSKYTDFEVDELYKSGDFELRHGGIRIESLKKGFEKVTVDCEYASCKIYTDSNVSFELDAVGKNATIQYPQDMNVSYKSKQHGGMEVKGQRGSGGGVILARISYGELKIK